MQTLTVGFRIHLDVWNFQTISFILLTRIGVERLALVTGAEIASTFDNPDQVQLGHADLVEEVIIGEDTLLRFSGVAKGEGAYWLIQVFSELN